MKSTHHNKLAEDRSHNKGQLRDWNDQFVDAEGSNCEEVSAIYKPDRRTRQSTSEYIRKNFGVLEELIEDGSDGELEIKPVSELLKRKRKNTVNVIRDMLGL